jgi:hypothetical protein
MQVVLLNITVPIIIEGRQLWLRILTVLIALKTPHNYGSVKTFRKVVDFQMTNDVSTTL